MLSRIAVPLTLLAVLIVVAQRTHLIARLGRGTTVRTVQARR
ncbi:hypothetical protein [Rhodococcus sp. NPDC003348]